MSPAAAAESTPMRVLIVEDEALVADEIQDRLERLGFEIVGVVDTGEDAVSITAGAQPDLVLMDIRLKGTMDGIEAASRIREVHATPIVFLTAHADRATLQRAKTVGPVGYVIKPFEERDLAITLEMAVHRHGLEQQLRASERRYLTTLASIADGVLATDVSGRVTYMNPVAEEITGWRGGAAIGLPAGIVFQLIDEATGQQIADPIDEALARGTTTRLERPALLVSRQGTVVPVDDCVSPLVDEQGRVTGAVAAFRDMRARRLAEEAAAKAAAQLRQAQKMEAIGHLAGGVAHDFNNLLTVINGYADKLLAAGSWDPSAERMLRSIQSAGARSAMITRQLLTFGRKELLAPQAIDVNALVSDIEGMLRRLIGEDLLLQTTLDPSALPVLADQGQVEQIIMNLVLNARDAMPQGGRIVVETARVRLDEPTATVPEIPPGDYTVLSVTDEGEGMDESTQAHIFEPFFTTKEPGKGTGLGLATVYGAVRQAGGHIYVYSEKGQGTVFKIYLPGLGTEQPAGAGAAAPVAEPLPVGHETVLLVEDEREVREFAVEALSHFGFAVLAAGSGVEALEMVRGMSHVVDIVVTDVVMPGMSGPQLAKNLEPLQPGIPVLFLSGYTDDAVVRRGVNTTAVALLQKPFSAVGLGRKVREMLDARGR